ncbi:hypothetical protein LPJ64_004024 [Coemansia asiatica]|uniref:MFS general substrate transporter n=1 Tax=Coemansia asiatica TaxID=1052880 RepID=A0A9W8CI91_9FUNG|nr:hypothetical protein LPJ64_004024 [Coemansia asiatica]
MSGWLPSSRSTAEVAQYVTLTLALGGLQFAWSVETGFGSLYLLSLGMRKSLVSLVWLAGPLSGLVTQPLVGILSDRCTARLGRRRPFVIGSTAAVVVCMGVIGWTRELAGDRPTLVIWLAVAAFYVLDFAINSIQATLRALIVDVLPTARQDNGTAWASRMIGVGNVGGYLMGFLDLVHLLPFLGSTQIQVLTTMASLVLSSTVAVTCYFTHEKPISRPLPGSTGSSSSELQALGAIFTSFRDLPEVIKRICRIQLFAWIGWFPFLFYGTTYVAGLYSSAYRSSGQSDDELMEQGTRAGSLAMFMQAVSSLAFSVVLPLFTYSAAAAAAASRSAARQSPRSSQAMRLLSKLRAAISVSLPTMWTVSLLLFSVCMFATLFASSVSAATWIIGVCGFSWAVAIWAPFSIIGETISHSNGLSHSGLPPPSSSFFERGYEPVATGDIQMNVIDRASDEISEHGHGRSLDGNNNSGTSVRSSGNSSLSAGTILGIHNVFIVIPQFLTAFLSSLLFAFFEQIEGSEPNSDPGAQHARQIAMVLRLGGIASAVAAYYSWKLSRNSI